MSSSAPPAPREITIAPPRHSAVARVAVVMVLALVTLLAAALLAASLLPGDVVTGRLLGAAGAATAGPNTQELAANLSQRLRLGAVLLLLLVGGLVVVRLPVEGLVRSTIDDITWPRWPVSRGEMLAVGLPVLLAVGLRVAFLNQPMRYDESLTFNEFAARPLYYGLSFYPDPNNHLLNTLLVHLTFLGLGNQPWVLRLPAFVGGVLLAPATYGLGRLLYTPRAGFLGAVLVAVSSYLVEYSTNARGYTLQALCFVCLLWLVIEAVRRDSPTALLLAAGVAAVGAYALPTMLYGVVVAAGWFAVQARGARLARIGPGQLIASGLVMGLVVVLAYLPVVVVSGADKLVSNRFVTPLDAGDVLRELSSSLGRTWAFWNRDLGLPIAGLLLIGFATSTVLDLRNRRAPLGLLAPLVCLALVVVQRVAPFERVWLFLLPLYLVVASAGLARFVDGRLLGVAFGAILGFFTLTSGSILASPETGAFPDAEAVAQTLRGRLGPDDAVLTMLPASLPELQYYFARAGLPIAPLVRAPQAAHRLFVAAAPDASPALDGWSSPVEVARFSGSLLFVLERPADV